MRGIEPEVLDLGPDAYFFVFPVKFNYFSFPFLAFIFSYYKITWLEIIKSNHTAENFY
jgi:hypothetical protein